MRLAIRMMAGTGKIKQFKETPWLKLLSHSTSKVHSPGGPPGHGLTSFLGAAEHEHAVPALYRLPGQQCHMVAVLQHVHRYGAEVQVT